MASQAEGIEKALDMLKPIRDLAQNWDIDVAGCLETFLRDLGLSEESREQIAASLTVNFAEAAIVLQHSSGVYSRKVDYLHTHVYKVQQELSSSLASTLNNNNKRANSKQSRGIDKEVEEFLNFDPHNEFLLLDDVLPTDQTGECNKINLNESSAADSGGDDPNLSMQTTGTTRLSMGSAFNRRLSLNASANTLDQTNASRTSSSTNNHHLRAFLGAAKDTGSLRLTGGTCDIGEEGVLFLPGSQSSSQQQSEQNKDQPPTLLNLENGGNGMDGNPQDDDFDFGGGGGDGGGFDDGMDDDNDDGGAGFTLADNVEDENNNNKHPSEMTAQQEKKRVTFADSTAAAAPLLKAKKPTVDPWACLDRDTPDNKGKPRPLRVGKTIVLPDTLDALPSECVTGTRTRRIARKQRDRLHPSERRQKQQQPPTHSSTETFQVSLGKRSLEDAIGNNSTATTSSGSGTTNAAVVQLKGLAYGNEFAYIAKATAKRKAEERRALRKQQMEEEEQMQVETQGENGHHDDEDNGDGGGFGFGGGDYDDDDNDYGGGGDVFGDDDQGHGPIHSNTGLASVDDAYQNNYDDGDANNRTFEDLCRAHIKAFARGAEKYAAETKLTTRVQKWQEKLIPLLEVEEQRPAFDIHAYGSTVIESMEQRIDQDRCSCLEDGDGTFKAKDPIVDFRDVTEDCESYEVCRLFLATLSLNNAGNVRFLDREAGDNDNLMMELLSTDIERPMETYLAPSVDGDGRNA